MASGLVALSSVAVLSVYTAGYLKTRAAAERLEGEGARRRAAAPVAAVASAPEAPPPTQAVPIIAPPPSSGPLPVRPAPEPAVPHVAASDPLPVVQDAGHGPDAEPSPSPEASGADTPSIPAAPVSAGAAAVAVLAPAAAPVAPVAPLVKPAAAAAQAGGDSTPATPEGAPQPGDRVPARYKDGMYLGWGSCRHGTIQARVVVENGRITSASIAKCLTRYSCSWIAPIVPQVVERQSAEVDYVTGATESADAFYYAVVAALDQAK